MSSIEEAEREVAESSAKEVAAFEKWRVQVATSLEEWVLAQARAHVVNEAEHTKTLGNERLLSLRDEARALALAFKNRAPESLVEYGPRGGRAVAYDREASQATKTIFESAGKLLDKLLTAYGYEGPRWGGAREWYDGDTKDTIGGDLFIPSESTAAARFFGEAARARRNAEAQLGRRRHESAAASVADIWDK